MLRIVLDTNVIISAVISKGKPRELVRLAGQKRFVLIKSKEIVEEFAKVLQREKFGMAGHEVLKAKNALAKTGKTVKDFSGVEQNLYLKLPHPKFKCMISAFIMQWGAPPLR